MYNNANCWTSMGAISGQAIKNYPSYIKKEVLIIPTWIQRALSRNKLNYMDVLDFSKISSILSSEDLIEFLAANTVITKQLFFFNESMTTGGELPIIRFMEEWLRSNQFISSSLYDLFSQHKSNVIENYESSVAIRLNESKTEFESVNAKQGFRDFYIIYMGEDRTIYLILKDNFMSQIADNEFKKMLYSDLLNRFYTLYPVHIVSDMNSIFKKYVSLL